MPTAAEVVTAISGDTEEPLVAHSCPLLLCVVLTVDRGKLSCSVSMLACGCPSIAQAGAARSEVRIGLRYAVRLGHRCAVA